MPEKIYWFQTKSTGENFEIYWSDLSDLSHVCIYKSSFFPQTIRDWNLVTDSLITASECAVDSVTKFTSLVRARD